MGAFNLTPFNRAAEQNSYLAQYSLFARVTGTMSPAARYEPEYNISAQMTGDMVLGYGYAQEWGFAQELTGEADLEALLTPPYSMSQSAAGAMNIYVLVDPLYDMAAAVTARAGGESAIFPAARIEARITGEMAAFPLFLPVWGSLVQHMDGVISVVQLADERAYIDLELQPGETITIDSDLYTVNVGGENALNEYTGVFVHLDRNIHSIEVPGGLDARILYTEAYL